MSCSGPEALILSDHSRTFLCVVSSGFERCYCSTLGNPWMWITYHKRVEPSTKAGCILWTNLRRFPCPRSSQIPSYSPSPSAPLPASYSSRSSWSSTASASPLSVPGIPEEQRSTLLAARSFGRRLLLFQSYPHRRSCGGFLPYGRVV